MQFWTLLFKNQTHFVCSTPLYTSVHRSDITNFKLLKVVNIYIKSCKDFDILWHHVNDKFVKSGWQL